MYLPAGRELHVRLVTGCIQHPVAQYGAEEQPRTTGISPAREIGRCEEYGPDCIHQQAVAIGNVAERVVERFYPCDQQGKADEICQQSRKHPSSERNFRLYAFADQSDAQVPDEHLQSSNNRPAKWTSRGTPGGRIMTRSGNARPRMVRSVVSFAIHSERAPRIKPISSAATKSPPIS